MRNHCAPNFVQNFAQEELQWRGVTVRPICSRTCENWSTAFITSRLDPGAQKYTKFTLCRPGLRSSDTVVYVKPRCRTKFGERGFSHAGPIAWNSLPHHLYQISDTGLFKRRLKTELFRRAYVGSSC